MREVAAIVIRDARLALAYPFRFWFSWFGIAVGVFSTYYVSQLVPPSARLGTAGHSGTYFAYVVVNVAFVGFQQTALRSFATGVRADQLYGTLEAILETPTPLAVVVMASGIWSFVLTSVQVAMTLALAALLGLDLRHADLTATATFIVLTVGVMISIGVVSAAAVVRFGQPGPTNVLVGGAASLLAGVLFPIALLPLPLRVVSWTLPLTHALAGIRGALNGASLATLAGDAWWLALVAVVLFPGALYLFAHAVERAKRDGLLTLH